MEKPIFATEAQQRIIDSKATVKFVSAAAGSGSSFLTAQLAADMEGDVLVVMPSTKYLSMCGGDEHIRQVLCGTHGYEFFPKDELAVSQTGKKVKFIRYGADISYYAENIIFEQAHFFPRDFLSKTVLRKSLQLTIISGVTEDHAHPCYKIAQGLFVLNKRHISLVAGFPYLAKERDSLADVLNQDCVDIEGFRMSLEDNPFLLKACPQYRVSIEQYGYKERMKLQGKWLFDLK